MPAARRDGRVHSCAGHERQGRRQDARIAAAASSEKTGAVTADTGTAEYTAVPPPTWRTTPTTARVSQADRRNPHDGRRASGSSVSSSTTATVAAVPPAIAVRT